MKIYIDESTSSRKLYRCPCTKYNIRNLVWRPAYGIVGERIQNNTPNLSIIIWTDFHISSNMFVVIGSVENENMSK